MRHTARMTWIWLFACCAVLLARVGEAHIHLCLDGTEAPAAVHLFDASVHHEKDGSSGKHVDSDVAASDDAVAKSAFTLAPFPVQFVSALVFLLPVEPLQRSSISVQPTPKPTDSFNFRPPLRGPPPAIL
jgi:hypothetical protein